MTHLNYYDNFHEKVQKIKINVLEFLILQKKQGKKVIAYGAAAKGNTLLNYCGIKSDLITFVVDKAPSKRGKFLPGSHIPVVDDKAIKQYQPDYILILPWNIQEEIIEQLDYIRKWRGKFVIPIPKFKIV